LVLRLRDGEGRGEKRKVTGRRRDGGRGGEEGMEVGTRPPVG